MIFSHFDFNRYFNEAEDDEETPEVDENEENFDVDDEEADTEGEGEETPEVDENEENFDVDEDDAGAEEVPDENEENFDVDDEAPADNEAQPATAETPQEQPVGDEGGEEQPQEQPVGDEGGEEQPQEQPAGDEGGEQPAGDEGGEEPAGDEGGDNPEGEEEQPDDNFDLPEDGGESEGGDEEGSEGDDESSDDNDSMDDPDKPDPHQKLKELENDIFSNLSDQEKTVKVNQLRALYIELHNSCDDILSKISSIPKEDETTKIYEFINNNLVDLKTYVKDYVNDTFDSKTYLENITNYQKYLVVLDNINSILEEIKTKNS